MIRKLSIENFYSIKTRQTLDLEIPRNAPDPDRRFVAAVEGSRARFPKVAVIYGANASGKTNVLHALLFLAEFVRDSVDRPRDEPFRYAPFNRKGGAKAPTRLEIEFDADIAPDDPGPCPYRYELDLIHEGKRVSRESLRRLPRGTVPYGKPRWLFVRMEDQLHFGRDFTLAENDPLRDKIRSDASVISTLAKFDHGPALAFWRFFGSFVTRVKPDSKAATDGNIATSSYLSDKTLFKRLRKEIRRLDLGIENVSFWATTRGLQPIFKHKGLDRPMGLNFESRGTQRFYNLYPYLWKALALGGVAVLDEVDADIHPLVLPEFVRMFQRSDTNPRNAQLIMSCQNATLLNNLVKEEIYFTEKDSKGCTHIYGLKDVRGVRRDLKVSGKYLSGVFGAVPRIG